MSVRFKEEESALACIQLMSGRWFDGKKVTAEIFDGQVKYEKSRDTEEDAAKRLESFEKWLEEAG